MKKNLKRFMALLLVLALTLPTFPSLSYGQEKNLEADLEWFRFKDLNSDTDKNIIGYLEDYLNQKNYKKDSLEIKVLESSDPEIIDLDGNIQYRKPEKEDFKNLNNNQVKVSLSINNVEKSYNIPIGYDKNYVRNEMRKDIVPRIEDLLETDFKDRLVLPSYIGGASYGKIKWSSTKGEFKKEGYGLKESNTLTLDKTEEISLKAEIQFNYDSNILIEENFTVKVLKEKEEVENSGQSIVDQFSVSMLKNFENGEKVDSRYIKSDIKLPIPREFGENHDNYSYEYKSTSNNVKINGYRAIVYRPLPGEDNSISYLSLKIRNKDTGKVYESKKIKLEIEALTDSEIEKELELMEKVKKDYSKALLADNDSEDKIRNNLSYYFVAYEDEGQLLYARDLRDFNQKLKIGIAPEGLEDWYEKQEWRIFKSSHPEIISHENLLVSPPIEDTIVTISSSLSSQIYGKYAEKYPEDPRFKNLYKQEISQEFKVLGQDENKSNTLISDELDFLASVTNAYMEEDSSGNTGNAKLSLTGTAAARLYGLDKNKIQKNIYIDKDNKTAYQVSQSIISLVGAGLDPKNYQGINLVDRLKESQVMEGENRGAFILLGQGIGNDINSIEAQIRSIIALDLVGETYDKELALEYLNKLYEAKTSKTYKEIETEGYMLLALSNHKDSQGERIDQIISFLSQKQDADGGYTIKGVGKGGTIGMGRLVQGLVSLGIDPLKDPRFIKNGNSILDAILRNKVEKSELKKSGYGKKANDNYNYSAGTQLVFSALLDLETQESIFHILRDEYKDVEQEEPSQEVTPDKKKIKLELAIVHFTEDGKYQLKDKIEEFEVLEGSCLLDLMKANYKLNLSGNFIREIEGIGAPDTGGWIYTVNDKISENYADNQILQDGDKIIWYRSYDYKRDKIYWEDLLTSKEDKDPSSNNEDKEEVRKYTLDEMIDLLNKNYEDKENLSFREALGKRMAGQSDFNSLKLRDNNSTANLAGNIIALVAANENPYDYKGQNYVKLLKDSQKPNGKFLVNGSEDYPTNQSFAIIALDLLGESYNDNTLDMLASYADENGSFGFMVDETAMVLMALANHPNYNKDLIGKSVSYINSNLENINLYSISAVIQGLKAVDESIDPDLLEKISQAFDEEKLFGSQGLNEQIYLALLDYRSDKSMYKKLRFTNKAVGEIKLKLPERKLYAGDKFSLDAVVKDSDGNLLRDKASFYIDGKKVSKDYIINKAGTYEVLGVAGNTRESKSLVIHEAPVSYKGDLVKLAGQEVNLEFQKNIDQNLTIITVIYSKEGDLVDYKINKDKASIKMPNSKDYQVKTFVWSDLDSQDILLRKPLEFKIAN